nr:MAG TPA: hypothetical protein [Caudoviricetes sp.]DAH93872.1 MAG TPA: hypothetical protein [Caudoviricetes sp.]
MFEKVKIRQSAAKHMGKTHLKVQRLTLAASAAKWKTKKI